MTPKEAIEVMFREWKCIDRNDGVHCDRQCEKCDLVMEVSELRDAFNLAISALQAQDEEQREEQLYCDRDICLRNEYNGIGCEECEVTKSQKNLQQVTTDTISRQEAIDILNQYALSLNPDKDSKELWKVKSIKSFIEQLPSAQPDVIRCRECVCGYGEVWLTGGGEATVYGYCGRTNLQVLPYDYCSRAERRTDG